MRHTWSRQSIAVAATVSVYAALIVLRFVVYHHPVGSVFQIGDRFCAVAGDHYNNIPIVKTSSGYDGQFYYHLALDPSAKNDSIPLKFDNAAYRQQRILFPLLIHLLSFGSVNAVPYVAVGINFIALLLVAFFTVSIAEHLGGSPFWGSLAVFYPGFAFCLFCGLPEPLLGFLVVFSLWAVLRRRLWLACIALCGAILTRETSAVIPLALGAALFYKRAVGSRSKCMTKPAQPYSDLFPLTVIPLAVLAAWQLYLLHAWGALPGAGGTSNFCLPLVDLVEKFLDSLPRWNTGLVYEWLLIAAFAVSGALAIKTIIGNRVDCALVFPFVIYMAMPLFFSLAVWMYRGGFLRALTEYYLIGTMILQYSGSKGVLRTHGILWSMLFIVAVVWLVFMGT